MELTAITPTPHALKALTHPVRIRILGLLRTEGPATATTMAARFGLNTGATSYHLRQLAQHGFVEEDVERGNGRDRWWRAAHQSTTTESPDAGDLEANETLDAYLQAVAVVYTERLQRAVEERGLLPERWRKASTLSDWEVRLTAAQARALVDKLAAIIDTTEENLDAEDAADFAIHIAAFPRPGQQAQPEASQT